MCQNCNRKFDKKSNYMLHIDPNRKYPCIKHIQEEVQYDNNDLKDKLIESEKRELVYKTKLEHYEKEIEYIKKFHQREIEYLKEK